MLSSISVPSKLLLTAIVESITISTIARISSNIRILSTNPVNCFLRSPRSSNALYIIVVEDMAIIPPKKMQSIRCHPKLIPTPIPKRIIQNIMVQAAMTAVPPTFTIFLKLNSSPNANRRKITPISAQVLILAESITEGV